MRNIKVLGIMGIIMSLLALAGCGGTATPGSAAAAASVSTAASANSAATLSGASGSQAASSGAATGSSAAVEGYSVGDPDSMFQDGAGAFTPSYTEGFYGIWVGAVYDGPVFFSLLFICVGPVVNLFTIELVTGEGFKWSAREV